MSEFKVGDLVRRIEAVGPHTASVASYRGEPFVITRIQPDAHNPDETVAVCPQGWAHFVRNIEHVEAEEKDAPPPIEDTYVALGEQVGTLLVHQAEAVKQIEMVLGSGYEMAQIMQLVGERHVEGFVEYGEEMYTKTERELWREFQEEIADAIAYLIARQVVLANAEAENAEKYPDIAF